MDPTTSSRPDAIVVLGCRVHENGLQGAAARRVHRAALAFHELSPAVLIASGGRRWRGTAEADALRDALVERGVPARVIVRELCSLSTLENAVYSAELLRAAGLEAPGLVTCDWHMARALSCFRRTGLRPVALPAPSSLGVAARLTRGTMERARSWVDRRVSPHWISR